MIGIRRPLGLVLATACLAAPGLTLPQSSEVSAAFREGVEALRQGDDTTALDAFQRVLALDPSREDAYDLWQSTEHEMWLKIMVKGGDFELVAKRLSSLARLGREERRNDPDAIRGLIDTALGDDVIERRRAVLQLSSQHGEFAVPMLLPYLADSSDDDRRVLAMQALSKMSTVVVPPLLEALSSDDAYLRRNVALVLGYIGDPRAGGWLAYMAQTDSDGSARSAAAEAAKNCGGTGNAVELLLQNGEDYHFRRGNVLGDADYSTVVWNWSEGQLASRETPRFLYGTEMSRRSYYRALQAQPGSLEARAGIARSYVDAIARVQATARAGGDVGEWESSVAYGGLALGAAGLDALDLALQWAVGSNDATTGAPLCEILGNNSRTVTRGLSAALQSKDGAIRAEAAAAAGTIAYRTGVRANDAVVQGLGAAAGRDVVQVAFVIDANTQRASQLADALTRQGMFVSTWRRGSRGLSMIRRAPEVDLVLVAESLPDLTAAQVVSEVREDERMANTPVFLISGNPEAADAWGDRISGAITGSADVETVMGALDEGLDGDRALADALAQRSAQTLARLAYAGHTDIGPALSSLANAFGRRDEVAVPAMEAVGAGGSTVQIPALVAVVVDGGRSEVARVAAADAVASILSRQEVQIGPEGVQQLVETATSDPSLGVRVAAVRALGRSALDDVSRARLLMDVRSSTSSASE